MGGEICPDLEFNPSLTIRHGNTEFRLYASLNLKPESRRFALIRSKVPKRNKI